MSSKFCEMLIELNWCCLHSISWHERWLEHNFAIGLVLHVILDSLLNLMEAVSSIDLRLQVIFVHLLHFHVHLLDERLGLGSEEGHEQERFKSLVLSKEVDCFDVASRFVR